MSRVAINTGLLALMKRRTYSTTAAAAKKTAEPKSTPASSGSKPPPESSSSWVPDPVTGYYQPGNRRVEIDAAKMRETLLSRRTQD